MEEKRDIKMKKRPQNKKEAKAAEEKRENKK